MARRVLFSIDDAIASVAFRAFSYISRAFSSFPWDSLHFAKSCANGYRMVGLESVSARLEAFSKSAPAPAISPWCALSLPGSAQAFTKYFCEDVADGSEVAARRERLESLLS